jgi:hypothetical protein
MEIEFMKYFQVFKFPVFKSVKTVAFYGKKSSLVKLFPATMFG